MEILTISPQEQEARLLSSVIFEYNDESQSLARDDRENLITFGDGQGNKFPIPFPVGEKVLWKEMRRFRNLIIHGITRFAEDGSITIRPSEKWKSPKYDADIEPFPNGLGQQVDGVYEYSLSDMRGLAGLFRRHVFAKSSPDVFRRLSQLPILRFAFSELCRTCKWFGS